LSRQIVGGSQNDYNLCIVPSKRQHQKGGRRRKPWIAGHCEIHFAFHGAGLRSGEGAIFLRNPQPLSQLDTLILGAVDAEIAADAGWQAMWHVICSVVVIELVASVPRIGRGSN